MLLSASYNYIGAFLTSRCCYHCAYCINWKFKCAEASAAEWQAAFKDLQTDLPVTLCGGEPSWHAGFYEIINGLPQKIDILTNLQFDPLEFINRVNPAKFDNMRTFAPIRISFHAQFMDISDTLDKIAVLMVAGLRVGLYCVNHQQNKNAIRYFKKIKWLDFQVKPLLENAVIEAKGKDASCRTKELLIAPDLLIYRCHRDLYKQENHIGKLGETDPVYVYRYCENADECHPCDRKLKRDRFGKEGYCAIEKN